jgi:uncharacterized protein (DUF2235 family)
MGVGKTVYKGEVETGVFAWFSCGQRSIVAALWERACSRKRYVSQLDIDWSTAIASRLAPTKDFGAAFLASKLPQINDREL